MSKTAVVTGANQGLGRALVEGLVQALGVDARVYLTGRDSERVQATGAALRAAALPVMAERVDVRSTEGVQAFAELVRERHGHVDIVISNAAARRSRDRSDADEVRTFVDTNNLGTTRMMRAFAPLVQTDSRFLVIASAFGSLRNLAPRLHDRFDTDAISLDEVDAVMLHYVDAVESGRAATEGWPASVNVGSKVGQVAAARVFAREQRAEASRECRLIAAVCPGLIDTDASRPWFADMSDAQSPEEAAVDVIGLAVDPIERASYGELIQHRRVLPWR